MIYFFRDKYGGLKSMKTTSVNDRRNFYWVRSTKTSCVARAFWAPYTGSVREARRVHTIPLIFQNTSATVAFFHYSLSWRLIMSARRQPSNTSLSKYAQIHSPILQNRSLDFCNSFWGFGDGGVDVLFARMRGAARTMEELKAFWKER